MKPEASVPATSRHPAGRVRVGARISASWLAATAASLFFLAAGTAGAADDRFDRTKYDGKGGFQPVANDAYRKECGTCHFAYLPGLLPARSWNRVMDQLGDHFGENVQLGDDLGARLRSYLAANAADKVADRGPAMLLERLEADKTPERITRIPLMIKMHTVIREVFKVNAGVQARNIANCDSCHQKAAEGSFALRDLVVPGLTKVVRPGGAF